jgi:3-deoxy-D-manno-octulosonic-acid transferase
VHTLSDTRLDRIADKVEQARRSPLLPQKLFDDAFTLVAGSVWPEDEDILIPAMERINRDEFVLRMIFVPHEPTESHIKQLQNRLGGSVLLSELIEQKELSGKNARLAIENKHIIVDSIGKLLKLYVHADAAYIGGAFGDGVHSVTEPAGYGVPLAAGTGTENSPDAPALENIGALRRLHDEDMAFFWLNEMIGDEEKRRTTGNKAGEYVMAARGSSEIIARKIAEKINI